MTEMENQLKIGNEKRATLRSTCRKRLAQHIWEVLSIKVKPSEVRLKTTEDETPYTWQVDDPSLEPLFQKHLSKHSVGAYMQLCREVGHKFRAIRADKGFKNNISGDLVSQLQAENLSLTEKLKVAEDQASRHKKAIAEAEEAIQSQKSIIREAQMTIQIHQQDIQHWMAVSECYQLRCIQCSNALGQMIAFLQGATFDNPTFPLCDR